MNVLSDFIERVNAQYPQDIDNEELNSLLTTIKNQGEEIEALQKELDKLKKKPASRKAKDPSAGSDKQLDCAEGK